MTDTPSPDRQDHDPLRDDAAMWFARMRGEDAAEHRAAFERWLAQGALHRAAYNRIGAVFAAGKVLKTGDGGDARRARPVLGVIAAVGTLLVAFAVLLPLWTGRLREGHVPQGLSRGETVSIGPGTVRSIALPQGSRAILDADARIVTDKSGSPAWSRLEGGRVRVSVPPRQVPQTILAGSYAVQSSDGIFDLWLRSDDSLDARILAGRIRIRPAIAFGPSGQVGSLQLVAGQHYRLRRGGVSAIVPPTSGSEWPQGVLDYRGAPLAEILEEANRYGAAKIVLADATLSTRRVSGRFRIDDPLLLATRLAQALSLRLDRSQPGMLVLRADKNILLPP